jgi:hypothetical protein
MSRRAIRRGFGLADITAALSDEARSLEEELGLEGSQSARKKGNERDDLIRKGGPFLTALGGLPLILLLVLAPEFFLGPKAFMFGVVLLWGLLLISAGPSVGEDSPLRALPIAERLLIGRFGRFLFRIAGIGVKQRKVDAPRDQRTEAFLASAADGIFDRLPKEIRRQFQAVRSLVERLESGAKALRKREAALSRVIAEAAPDSAPRSGLTEGRRQAVRDLEAARKEAHDRLEETVTALETSASICCDSRRALARRTI